MGAPPYPSVVPEFTQDYFSHHIPDWQRVFATAGWAGPRTVVEIGSHEGRSAMWMAENLLAHPESRLYCIDTWDLEGRPEGAERLQRFQANIAELPNRSAVIAMKARSEAALVQLRGQGVRADFVYVDGSHRAPEVLSDLVLSFGMLKRGGFMICDDYLWTAQGGDPGDLLSRPKLAIDAFTSIYARRIHMPGSYPVRQIIIQKI